MTGTSDDLSEMIGLRAETRKWLRGEWPAIRKQMALEYLGRAQYNNPTEMLIVILRASQETGT